MSSDIKPDDTMPELSEALPDDLLDDDMIEEIDAMLQEESDLEAAAHELRNGATDRSGCWDDCGMLQHVERQDECNID